MSTWAKQPESEEKLWPYEPTNTSYVPNGHRGVEKTTEHDQPYSDMWELVSVTGMVTAVTDGKSHYRCSECGELMSPTDNIKS